LNVLPPARGARAALLLVLAGLAGCAGPAVIVNPHDPSRLFQKKPAQVLEGKASYYWEDVHTASGERFNANAYTAAHKSLPFDTTVRVINLKNGKAVLVRINDRGPYVRGRIIDLSRRAAQEIDMTRAGVVPVRVEVLKPIEIVEKPNLRTTARLREDARKRAQEAAREVAAPPPKPAEPARVKTHAATAAEVQEQRRRRTR
jgi:rare lipoprotein A